MFWELTAIRFLIVGLIVFGFLLFMQPFISCWLGNEYLLSDLVVYLLLFNVFIMLSRGVVEMYISASGLFQDVWAAWTELFVNIGVTLALAPFLGIPGILIGKIVSVFFIAMFWKPYFLFTQGLHLKVNVYWCGMFPYYLIFALFTAIVVALKLFIIDPRVDSWGELILYGVILVPLLMSAYFLTLFTATKGMKYFIARKPAIYNRLHFLNPSK